VLVAFNELRVVLPNGEAIQAATEEWVSAIIMSLSETDRDKVFAVLRKQNIKRGPLVGDGPVKGGYNLNAEGLLLGIKGHGVGE
jgi:hypothetical protein